MHSHLSTFLRARFDFATTRSGLSRHTPWRPSVVHGAESPGPATVLISSRRVSGRAVGTPVASGWTMAIVIEIAQGDAMAVVLTSAVFGSCLTLASTTCSA